MHDCLLLSVFTTSRKCLSVVLSSIIFQHAFSTMQWAGASMVLGGTILEVYFKHASKPQGEKVKPSWINLDYYSLKLKAIELLLLNKSVNHAHRNCWLVHRHHVTCICHLERGQVTCIFHPTCNFTVYAPLWKIGSFLSGLALPDESVSPHLRSNSIAKVVFVAVIDQNGQSCI